MQSQPDTDRTQQRTVTQSTIDSLSRKLALRDASVLRLKQQGFTNIEDLMLLTEKDLKRLNLTLRDEARLRSSKVYATKSRGVTNSTNEQSSAYYDIVDFVPGVVNVKECFIEAGPKRQKLETVSPCQWGSTNARILYKLMAEGTFTYDDVHKYLPCTVKIFQLGERFMLESCIITDNTGSCREQN